MTASAKDLGVSGPSPGPGIRLQAGWPQLPSLTLLHRSVPVSLAWLPDS
ncbi:hypothetical protein HMPREF3223_01672 [Cutibacterium avidum]|nr:hypothetical protein HMPREF3223_01672 [Cutibacterium avidum]